MTVPPLTVDLGDGSAWHGFLAMVELGGDHILTGTDHLLFLLILLLPAPLLATRGRWHGQVGARAALVRIGRITLAFTVGHSVALAATAIGRLEIPGRPVEAFIAASIVVGAVHAIRPLFPGREAVVAGVFGLGHGMAFSFVLAEMQLSTGQLAFSLLGFNLGIELVQLLLVCLALPSLLVIARLRIQPAVRVGGALLTGTAAVGWLADRLGAPNPVARAADSAGSHTIPMVVTLALAAIAAVGWTLATRATRRRALSETVEGGLRLRLRPRPGARPETDVETIWTGCGYAFASRSGAMTGTAVDLVVIKTSAIPSSSAPDLPPPWRSGACGSSAAMAGMRAAGPSNGCGLVQQSASRSRRLRCGPSGGRRPGRRCCRR